MKKIKLEQGSSEWKKWRSSGITATDMTVIMGVNPYTTKKLLYDIKWGGATVVESEAMIRGNEYESLARYKASYELDMKFEAACVVSDENPIFRASLDGIFEDTICEIKVPKYENFERFLDKNIEMYKCQVYWQMIVTGAQKACLFVYRPEDDEYKIHWFDYPVHCENEMKQAAIEFWELCTEANTNPFRIEEITSPFVKMYVEQYKKICDEITILSEKKSNLRDLLLKGNNGSPYACNGLIVDKRKLPSKLNKTLLSQYLQEHGKSLNDFTIDDGQESFTIRLSK